MKEHALIKEFRIALTAALKNTAYAVQIIEAAQPNKQGRTETGIYYQTLNPKNIGWQKRKYDVDTDKAINEQHYELTMQLNCFVSDDTDSGFTSKDLAQVVQMHMQTLNVIGALRAKKIGVQRPSPIRTLRFLDEFENYAVESSFDVVLTYTTKLEASQSFTDTLTPKTVGAI